METINTQMKIHRLDCHLNILEREVIDFAETWKSDTVPQRIDDLRVILAGMQGIVRDILEPTEVKGSMIRVE